MIPVSKIPGSNISNTNANDSSAINENSAPRADGQERCMAVCKFGSKRCTKAQCGNSNYCGTHLVWASLAGSVEGYENCQPVLCQASIAEISRADSSALDTSGDSQASRNSGVEEEEELQLPASQSELNIDVPIEGIFDSEVNSQPTDSTLGKVATEEELVATKAESWDEVDSHVLKYLQQYLPDSERPSFTPNSTKVKTLLQSIVSANISKPAFGGKEKSKFCVALLLGNISNLNKLHPALQLNEILGWLQHFRPDFVGLDCVEAQKTWVDEDNNVELPKDSAELRERVGSFCSG